LNYFTYLLSYNLEKKKQPYVYSDVSELEDEDAIGIGGGGGGGILFLLLFDVCFSLTTSYTLEFSLTSSTSFMCLSALRDFFVLLNLQMEEYMQTSEITWYYVV
jgi:hypothetical protein